MIKSSLFDEKTFYKQFKRNLLHSRNEVLIESPFITTARMNKLAPVFKKMVNRGVKVFVITRDPKEHKPPYAKQSELEIQHFERIGVQVLVCLGNHHRKLAIIDRKILWEGSLNILSHAKSREIMRRIDDRDSTEEMFSFLKLGKFI